ncbi:DinB family protein [Psychrobacillus sp. NEAU-3TGS]|uniref:DinB family protein n=1 Tax=Psychrobacillus sp. NEAU-3TGS TaxID=2995412 RepID=UPI002498E92E|nr:DinB family protein [Psychrobacillus sp. NEAU-3TGS]MDI2588826.1 DinB family protein [Psychrobacillus sp. NEAU-3TGS]
MYKLLEEDEYAPNYSSYVKLVPDEDFIQTLTKQMEKTIGLLLDISDEQAHFRYAREKWSVKEVIGHMADTERVMAYRLLAIARGDTASLPGFEEKEYAQHASFDKQSVKDLLQNLNIVRQSTIHLIKSLAEKDLLRRGTTNNSEVTVRALIAIIIGHELHHCNIIRDRYFGAAAYPENK